MYCYFLRSTCGTDTLCRVSRYKRVCPHVCLSGTEQLRETCILEIKGTFTGVRCRLRMERASLDLDSEPELRP